MEDHLSSVRLAEVMGRGWNAYPDMKPARPGPLVVPVAPLARYDASALSSLTVAAGAMEVSQWNDLAGSAHASQSTGVIRPTLAIHPTLLNRRLALMFGGDDRMAATGLPADDRTETVFAVGIVNDVSSYRTILGSNSNAGRQIRFDQTNGKVTVNSEGTAGILTTTTIAVVPGTPYVLCVKLDTSTWEVRMSGQTTETGSNSTTFTAGRSSIIGENTPAAAERYYGLLGEIIVYGTALSSGNITSVMSYLCAKWGVTP